MPRLSSKSCARRGGAPRVFNLSARIRAVEKALENSAMSVRKRLLRDGQIRWQIDYKDNAGIRRHRQFATKREAEAFHAKARSEVVAGIHTPDQRLNHGSGSGRSVARSLPTRRA